MLTTQAAIRRAFWEQHPNFTPRKMLSRDGKIWPVDVRCTFVDFVDHLCRDGQISEALAQRVTL